MTKAVAFPLMSSRDGDFLSDLANYFAQPQPAKTAQSAQSMVFGEVLGESPYSAFESLPSWMLPSALDPKGVPQTRLAAPSSTSSSTESPNSPSLDYMNSSTNVELTNSTNVYMSSSTNVPTEASIMTTAMPMTAMTMSSPTPLFPPPPGLVLRRLPEGIPDENNNSKNNNSGNYNSNSSGNYSSSYNCGSNNYNYSSNNQDNRANNSHCSSFGNNNYASNNSNVSKSGNSHNNNNNNHANHNISNSNSNSNNTYVNNNNNNNNGDTAMSMAMAADTVRQPVKPGRVPVEQAPSKSRSGAAQSPTTQQPYPSVENGQLSQGELLLAACYKTQMCRYYLKGSCRSGKECRFAHTPEELHVRSNLRRTSLCVRWQAGVCRAGQSCRFAHGHWELGPIEASARRSSDASANSSVDGSATATATVSRSDSSSPCPSETTTTATATATATAAHQGQTSLSRHGFSWTAQDISGSPALFEDVGGEESDNEIWEEEEEGACLFPY